MDNKSISHTRWKCQYHIVFIPKYRKKVLYGKVREDVREILNTLCKYKNVEIEKNENKSSFELIYKIDYSNTTNEIKQEFNLEELESNQVKNLEKQGYSCK